jgi:hypothetical protein
MVSAAAQGARIRKGDYCAPEIQKTVEANHRQQQETKTTLVDVAGL